MTNVTTKKQKEPFGDALKRARIRMLCGGSAAEYRCLKRIEKILDRDYCTSGSGNIRINKKRG